VGNYDEVAALPEFKFRQRLADAGKGKMP